MHDPSRPRLSTRRLLLVIGGGTSVLCVIFGATIVRQHRAFSEYRRATLESGPMPWETAAMEPAACVGVAVEWAMACPGLGTWCENEAPRLVTNCMASRDRTEYCAEVGDAPARTDFGFDACVQMRETVGGRQAQRSHKKFCAAAYRAVAEACRR